MNKETQSIIKSFETTLSGQPWFGRGVYEMLEEIDEKKIYVKPNENAHSLAELLWHMNVWAEFTLAALENRNIEDIKAIEQLDWRTIDPAKHTWKNGLTVLKSIHNKIIEQLKQKEDSLLGEIVPNRKYNYRFLLNGLIQHNIYHLGQVAYVKKLLS
jgi:uncharacterized damage-inducible protein DinB